jgi:hypothetical protein
MNEIKYCPHVEVTECPNCGYHWFCFPPGKIVQFKLRWLWRRLRFIGVCPICE